MKKIGFMNKKPYIIAEIGANHNGEFEIAKKLVKKAKESGVDCVKFQIKTEPNELATQEHASKLDSGKVNLENVKDWSIKELGISNIFEAARKFHFDKCQYEELIKYANELEIDVSASVFSKEGVDFLVKNDISFIKIASMDFINTDLLNYIFSTGVPLVVSTGMCSEDEISEFFYHLPKEYYDKTAILHCVSLYPPDSIHLQLKFISTLKKRYNIPVGFSDHTVGTLYPLLSFALGGSILEKHFTLDNSLPGWDHKISANPKEMKYICENAINVVDALGDGAKKVSSKELEKRKKFRRSLTTTRRIRKGEKIKEKDITFKRPGTGIPVNRIDEIIGKKVKKDIDYDTTIYWDDIKC